MLVSTNPLGAAIKKSTTSKIIHMMDKNTLNTSGDVRSSRFSLSSPSTTSRIARVLLASAVLLGTGFHTNRMDCRAMSLLLGLSGLKPKDWVAIFALMVMASFTPLKGFWRFKKVGMIAYYGLTIAALFTSSILVKRLPSKTFSDQLKKVTIYSSVDQIICAFLFNGIAGIPLKYLIDNFWVFAATILVATYFSHEQNKIDKLKE
jgi:hypothetical protein